MLTLDKPGSRYLPEHLQGHCKEALLLGQLLNSKGTLDVCGRLLSQWGGRGSGLRNPVKLKESWNKWNVDLAPPGRWRSLASISHTNGVAGNRCARKQLLPSNTEERSPVTWDLAPGAWNVCVDSTSLQHHRQAGTVLSVLCLGSASLTWERRLGRCRLICPCQLPFTCLNLRVVTLLFTGHAPNLWHSGCWWPGSAAVSCALCYQYNSVLQSLIHSQAEGAEDRKNTRRFLAKDSMYSSWESLRPTFQMLV